MDSGDPRNRRGFRIPGHEILHRYGPHDRPPPFPVSRSRHRRCPAVLPGPGRVRPHVLPSRPGARRSAGSLGGIAGRGLLPVRGRGQAPRLDPSPPRPAEGDRPLLPRERGKHEHPHRRGPVARRGGVPGVRLRLSRVRIVRRDAGYPRGEPGRRRRPGSGVSNPGSGGRRGRRARAVPRGRGRDIRRRQLAAQGGDQGARHRQRLRRIQEDRPGQAHRGDRHPAAGVARELDGRGRVQPGAMDRIRRPRPRRGDPRDEGPGRPLLPRRTAVPARRPTERVLEGGGRRARDRPAPAGRAEPTARIPRFRPSALRRRIHRLPIDRGPGCG